MPQKPAPFDQSSMETGRLLVEAQSLRDRLRRLLVALAMSEETVADVFETLAAHGGVASAERRFQSRRARAAAEECRKFDLRLIELSDVPQQRFGDTDEPSDGTR